MRGHFDPDKTNMTRRSWIKVSSLVAIVAASSSSVIAMPSRRAPKLNVRRNPGCSCCEGWADHLRKAGFEVDLTDDPDLAAYKASVGVPNELAGCHTGVGEGYIFEGHIPATSIQRLLRERPQVKGIAVAGMPMGSPGMEGEGASPYDVMAFDDKKSWLYEKVTP